MVYTTRYYCRCPVCKLWNLEKRVSFWSTGVLDAGNIYHVLQEYSAILVGISTFFEEISTNPGNFTTLWKYRCRFLSCIRCLTFIWITVLLICQAKLRKAQRSIYSQFNELVYNLEIRPNFEREIINGKNEFYLYTDVLVFTWYIGSVPNIHMTFVRSKTHPPSASLSRIEFV